LPDGFSLATGTNGRDPTYADGIRESMICPLPNLFESPAQYSIRDRGKAAMKAPLAGAAAIDAFGVSWIRLGRRHVPRNSNLFLEAHQTTLSREWRITSLRPVRFRTAIVSAAGLLSLRNSWNPDAPSALRYRTDHHADDRSAGQIHSHRGRGYCHPLPRSCNFLFDRVPTATALKRCDDASEGCFALRRQRNGPVIS
jgi:hypothetical protein